MKLIIARHGQTDDNIGGEMAKRSSEVQLNKEGRKQAQKLGVHLRSEKIVFVYTSPQKRAVETVKEIIAHHPAATLVHAEELRERDLGVYENLSKGELKEVLRDIADPWHLHQPKNGESYVQLQARTDRFVQYLLKKHPHDTVLLVSHGGPLGVLTLDLLDQDLSEENYRTYQPKNAEFTMVEFLPKGKKVHVLNQNIHLGS